MLDPGNNNVVNLNETKTNGISYNNGNTMQSGQRIIDLSKIIKESNDNISKNVKILFDAIEKIRLKWNAVVVKPDITKLDDLINLIFEGDESLFNEEKYMLQKRYYPNGTFDKDTFIKDVPYAAIPPSVAVNTDNDNDIILPIKRPAEFDSRGTDNGDNIGGLENQKSPKNELIREPNVLKSSSTTVLPSKSTPCSNITVQVNVFANGEQPIQPESLSALPINNDDNDRIDNRRNDSGSNAEHDADHGAEHGLNDKANNNPETGVASSAKQDKYKSLYELLVSSLDENAMNLFLYGDNDLSDQLRKKITSQIEDLINKESFTDFEDLNIKLYENSSSSIKAQFLNDIGVTEKTKFEGFKKQFVIGKLLETWIYVKNYLSNRDEMTDFNLIITGLYQALDRIVSST